MLRNHTPIDTLIEKHLKLPSKFSEGFFRFLCPLCNEFQTATNPKTNLARCFRCERNFKGLSGFPNTNLTNKYYRLYQISRKSTCARMGHH